MKEKVYIQADASHKIGTLDHTWNYIGYDECNYTHCPGGIELLEKFSRLEKEKPYYVRAHHMLCTGNRRGDVVLTLDHLPMKGNVRVQHYRIDALHSNACAEWERQGRPDWPDEKQRLAILARSGLEFYEPPAVLQIRDGRLEQQFTLPTHGISLLIIENAGCQAE